MTANTWSATPDTTLRVGPDFKLLAYDFGATPGWSAGERAAVDYMTDVTDELSDLQERLFAQAKNGGHRSVLIVLQGMDTAGKGGIVRHVLGLVDPQGVALRSFGVPTKEERKHHYLWRIRRALPPAGQIGVFDRSHYEDVLVARVDHLVPEDVWRKRYAEINRFEQRVIDSGTTIIKCALLVSYPEQTARLAERLRRPDKYWKYNPSDVDARLKWPDYALAYQEMFEHTNTDAAPWYAIPANNKWYSRLAITELLLTRCAGWICSGRRLPSTSRWRRPGSRRRQTRSGSSRGSR
jgi:PPK2 family polyphosphate:nucleotide phosphotransferase